MNDTSTIPRPQPGWYTRYWDGKRWQPDTLPVTTEPPKKSVGRKVLVGSTVALAFIVGISIGSIGSQPTQPAAQPRVLTKTVTVTPKPKATKTKVVHPKHKAAPDAAVVGNWRVIGEPVVKPTYGDFDLTLRVQNTSDTADQPFIDATFMRGSHILGTAMCDATNVAAGHVVTLTCSSNDHYRRGWTHIEYQNSF
jgi:hypothetical protein